MKEQDMIEADFYFTLMDAAYFVDQIGIDKFLQVMVQYCVNPEQEQIVQQIINSFVHTDITVH